MYVPASLPVTNGISCKRQRRAVRRALPAVTLLPCARQPTAGGPEKVSSSRREAELSAQVFLLAASAMFFRSRSRSLRAHSRARWNWGWLLQLKQGQSRQSPRSRNTHNLSPSPTGYPRAPPSPLMTLLPRPREVSFPVPRLNLSGPPPGRTVSGEPSPACPGRNPLRRIPPFTPPLQARTRREPRTASPTIPLLSEGWLLVKAARGGAKRRG